MERSRLHRALGAALLLAACSRPAPPAAPGGGAPSATAGGQPPPPEAATAGAGRSPAAPPAGAGAEPSFTNRIWKVAKSSDVEPGTYYVFLADGSMLITSAHGTPSLGSWRYSGEVLTMVEKGLPHPATVLQATQDTLAIRIAGPGQPVLVTFVPATAP